MDITAIAIVAIVCWAIVELFGRRKKDPLNDALEQQIGDNGVDKELQELRDRVAALEKIVTDQEFQLKREIDSL